MSGRDPSADMLPEPVRVYFRERVSEGFGAPHEHLFDPKTALVQRLAALRMHWRYDTEATGPSHSRKFRSKLLLKAPLGNETATITGGSGSARRDADKELALRVMRLFDVANEGLATDESVKDWQQPLRRIASFLLMSEARSIHASESPLDLTRLASIGILGGPLLSPAELTIFAPGATSPASF